MLSVQEAGWPQAFSGATLTVDLDALVSNYLYVTRYIAPARCAAVLKDDAYGVGANYIAPALYAHGARIFFVAYSYEGIKLREVVGDDCIIYVLHDPFFRDIAFWQRHQLRPVFHDIEAVTYLRAHMHMLKVPFKYGVQLNTGMSRLGMSLGEIAQIETLLRHESMCCTLVMSHLACAVGMHDAYNQMQLAQFSRAIKSFPQTSLKSLAATDGTFLGRSYIFDLVRAGAILYGMAPANTAKIAQHLKPVIKLRAKILQIHELQKGEGTGYGIEWRAPRPSRIAIIAAGYGDGLGWAAQHGCGWYAGIRVPFVGRMSMDCTAVDITDIPGPHPQIFDEIELLNEHYNLDEAAKLCGCSGYEILTSLSLRYHRRYVRHV